jgi:hypothetical protein
MKRAIILIIMISVLAGCKAAKTVEFCEGVSPEGEGLNCGGKFSTGEITVLIKPGSSFEVPQVNIDIYSNGDYKAEKVDSVSLKVNPEDTSARSNLHFYNEGDFLVEVTTPQGKKIAEGNVSIIDIYQ